MGLSKQESAKRAHVIDDLRTWVSDPHAPADTDPQYRADQAIRDIESGLYRLLELGPHAVDCQRIAGLAGDLRELALTAYDVQRILRRVS